MCVCIYMYIDTFKKVIYYLYIYYFFIYIYTQRSCVHIYDFFDPYLRLVDYTHKVGYYANGTSYLLQRQRPLA